MPRRIIVFAAICLVLAGCTLSRRPPAPPPQPTGSPIVSPSPSPAASSAVTLPITGYRDRRTSKVYGQYVADRFTGYHTGDDVEYVGDSGDVPVYAIADGEIVEARRANGYGGMMVIAHTISGRTVSALYGHLDPASMKTKGNTVSRSEQIAILGDHQSAETDGERKHLHFHLWDGGGVKIAGYAPTATALGEYLNPTDFFLGHGIDALPAAREIRIGENGTPAPHPTFDGLSFTLPTGWAVEYVPQIASLNLFNLDLDGIRTETARGRSKIFIRTFTADRFLTLDTVTIHETQKSLINDYETRVYLIEKKSGIPDFPFQPTWRNGRHVVTDLRAHPGRSIFYVVAQSPVGVDDKTYLEFLHSLRFTNE